MQVVHPICSVLPAFETGSEVIRVVLESRRSDAEGQSEKAQLMKGGVKMAEERMNLLTAKEAARYLRVSMFTLSKIEREGGLVPYRTPGGHRRYSLRMLNRYLNNSRQRKEV
jgi:excisionase family DNA binding protein